MYSPIKCHGGKHYEAKKIVALMPPHTHYAEPYFGSGAVLFAKDPEGVSETVNDLDGELSNFWITLQNPNSSKELLQLLSLCPLSQLEFEEAVIWREISAGYGEGVRLKKALSFFVRNRQSRQALGKDYATPTRRVRRGMNEHVSAWLSAVDGLPEVVERLRRVEIRCMDGIEFIKLYDHEDCLFYCDPPYPHRIRQSTREYGLLEMSDQQHMELLKTLAGIKGKFILSSYPNTMYDCFAVIQENWRTVDLPAHNRASSKKTKEKTVERLYMNFKRQE